MTSPQATIEIPCAELSRALRLVAPLIKERGDPPFRAFVDIYPDTGVWRMHATDHRVSMVVDLNDVVDVGTSVDRFGFAPRWAHLHSLVAGAKGFCRIQIGDHSADIRLAADSARARIPLLPNTQYPTTPEDPDDSLWAPVDAAGFARDLAFAVEQASPAREHLSGVCLDAGRAIATDALSYRVAEDMDVRYDADFRPILSREWVDTVARCSRGQTAAEISVTDRLAFWSAGGILIAGLLLEGPFPDMTRVLGAAEAQPSKVSCDADQFLESLGRMHGLADQKNKSGTKLVTARLGSDALTLCTTQALNDVVASCDVPVEWVSQATERTIVLNSTHVLDGVAALQADRIVVQFGGPHDVVSFRRATESRHLFGTMPCRGEN